MGPGFVVGSGYRFFPGRGPYAPSAGDIEVGGEGCAPVTLMSPPAPVAAVEGGVVESLRPGSLNSTPS